MQGSSSAAQGDKAHTAVQQQQHITSAFAAQWVLWINEAPDHTDAQSHTERARPITPHLPAREVTLSTPSGHSSALMCTSVVRSSSPSQLHFTLFPQGPYFERFGMVILFSLMRDKFLIVTSETFELTFLPLWIYIVTAKIMQPIILFNVFWHHLGMLKTEFKSPLS